MVGDTRLLDDVCSTQPALGHRGGLHPKTLSLEKTRGQQKTNGLVMTHFKIVKNNLNLIWKRSSWPSSSNAAFHVGSIYFLLVRIFTRTLHVPKSSQHTFIYF